MLFYPNAAVNFDFLQAKLERSGLVEIGALFDEAALKRLLIERFDAIDFEAAKEDVADFIKDRAILNCWSADYFRQLTQEYAFT